MQIWLLTESTLVVSFKVSKDLKISFYGAVLQVNLTIYL